MTLREYLFINRIKKKDFADRVGISTGYTTKISEGQQVPSMTLAIKIETATAGAVPVASWIDSSQNLSEVAND